MWEIESTEIKKQELSVSHLCTVFVSIQSNRDLDVGKSRQRLEPFEIRIWRGMMISWVDRISNEEVLAQVNDTRTMLSYI